MLSVKTELVLGQEGGGHSEILFEIGYSQQGATDGPEQNNEYTLHRVVSVCTVSSIVYIYIIVCSEDLEIQGVQI